LGANVMNVTVLRNEQTVYTREQAFGGSQLTQDIMRRVRHELEEAEAAKRSGGLPENYESEVLRPSWETRRWKSSGPCSSSLHRPSTLVEHVLLTGGSAVIPGLDEMVQARTQINALVANPFASMAISPRVSLKKLVADAPSLMVACGLPCGDLTRDSPSILLPWREARRKAQRQHLGVLGGMVAC